MPSLLMETHLNPKLPKSSNHGIHNLNCAVKGPPRNMEIESTFRMSGALVASVVRLCRSKCFGCCRDQAVKRGTRINYHFKRFDLLDANMLGIGRSRHLGLLRIGIWKFETVNDG